MASSRLQQLSELGQSVWIDYLSRRLIQSGELERLSREHAVVGVTSNPTIFQKALVEGDAYDEQLRDVLARQDDAKEVFLELAVKDVQDACDLLRSVWDGGQGKDGYVSIEVDPNLASDTDATIDEAQRLHELVDRPNCFVKIPATKAGLPAIEEMIARGRNINVTLIFSLERYAEVVEAYLRGLERLVESGGDLAKVASVASFFVSRVDTEADRRLDEAGAPDELKGKLAVANAKLAYQRYKEFHSGGRWEKLSSHGATKQRCLWASTSTKNPDLPRRPLRRGADRPRDGRHDARGDDRGLRGPRRGSAHARARRGWGKARVRAGQGSRCRLRRRGCGARAGGRAEVLRLVLGAARRHPRQARRARLRLRIRLVELHSEVAGEGPAVALLHEGICDSRMWDSQWETFARSHRVLRFDFRGFGESPLEEGAFSNARDTIELLDRHRFERFALVGVSLGGRVAIEVALAAPERVSALVLVGSGLPGHDWNDEMKAAWDEEETALRAGDVDAAVEVTLRTWVDGPRRKPGDVDPQVRARVAEMQRRAIELQLPFEESAQEQLLVEDVADRLGEIETPTLVLVGEEDVPDIHAISDRLAREIPNARLETIANTAHVPSMERPEEFDRLVLGFLESV